MRREWDEYKLICNHVLTTGPRKGEHCGRKVATKYFEDTTKCETHISESIRDEIFCECCDNRAVKGYIRCSECLPAKKKEINYELRILDTFAFMSSSLENLTTSLKPKKPEDKETLREFIDR